MRHECVVAVFLIVKDDPPTFKDPARCSPAFLDFVTQCLNKNPDLRPTAKELSTHPFVLQAQGRGILLQMMEKYSKDTEEQALRKEQRCNALTERRERIKDIKSTMRSSSFSGRTNFDRNVI